MANNSINKFQGFHSPLRSYLAALWNPDLQGGH